MDKNKFSAIDSALGYYYQSLYALIYLLNSKEDTEEILLEDLDDVVVKNIETNVYSLKQLKHKKNSTITIASKDLWSTLRIWCELAMKTDIGNVSFHLITCSSLSEKDQLNILKEDDSDRSELIEALNIESRRVLDARAKETSKNKPYKDRYQGCEIYNKLDEHQKTMLLNRIKVIPNEFDIFDSENQVCNSFLLRTCPPELRGRLAKQLIEWWDYQALQQMMKKRNEIKKAEIQYKILEIIQDIELNNLGNSYSEREPLNWADELTENINGQLEIIKCGNIIKKHAAINYWQAREQRAEWLDEDFPLVNEKINKFDKNLADEWEFYFGMNAENVAFNNESEIIACGKKIFNWSHNDAHKNIPKIFKNGDEKYLVRGSYQILADTLKVGWHPNYKTKLQVKS